MRNTIHFMTLAALLIGAAGCNQAKSPDSAEKDIVDASRSAVKEVADAQRTQQKDMSTDAYDVAVARADGDHKISIQKCDVLEGHDQKTCKDQADADYDAAKANAKALKVAEQP